MTFINIFHCFSEKIRLDVSSEFSAMQRMNSSRQRIHMKNQALFTSKDKIKKGKCRLLQFLFGALRVYSKVMRISNHNLFPVYSRLHHDVKLELLLLLFMSMVTPMVMLGRSLTLTTLFLGRLRPP